MRSLLSLDGPQMGCDKPALAQAHQTHWRLAGLSLGAASFLVTQGLTAAHPGPTCGLPEPLPWGHTRWRPGPARPVCTCNHGPSCAALGLGVPPADGRVQSPSSSSPRERPQVMHSACVHPLQARGPCLPLHGAPAAAPAAARLRGSTGLCPPSHVTLSLKWL